MKKKSNIKSRTHIFKRNNNRTDAINKVDPKTNMQNRVTHVPVSVFEIVTPNVQLQEMRYYQS